MLKIYSYYVMKINM